ncbi:MAG: hypothetical protein PHG67_07405 [Bacteroidales bacterium]|jgi:hypothetical protein|nr:hypothetical protein [Bacteroidales bacterium]
MNTPKRLNYLFITPIILVSIFFMAFIPRTDKYVQQEIDMDASPFELPSSRNLSVGWKEVNVYQRLSGVYYIKYSDLVSGIDPDHHLTYGCGYLDINNNTVGWDCNVTETWFSASGALPHCEYIKVTSNSTPTPGNHAIHTINIRVKDDEGEESNWGGITLNIFYTPFPSASQPQHPCMGS